MRLLAFTLALLSASGASAAAPCHEEAVQTGPVAFSYEAGGLGSARRACPRTEVFGSLSGQAIAEAANFYGNIQASARVGGSLALLPRLELHLDVEAFHFRNVIQSIQATHAGLGHTRLGATVIIARNGALVVSALTRATLPTAVGLYQNTFPLGLEAGFLASWAPLDQLFFHAHLTGAGSVQLSAGNPLPRLGYSSSVSVEYLPFDWLSLVATGSSLALYQADLDHLSLAGAARVRIWEALSAEIFVAAPIGGAERNLGHGGLSVRYRL